MFEAVENIAHAYPNNIAFTFMGRSDHVPADGAGG